MRDNEISLRRSSRGKKTKRNFPTDSEEIEIILPPKLAYKKQYNMPSKILRRSTRLQEKNKQVIKPLEVEAVIKPKEVKAVVSVNVIKSKEVKPVMPANVKAVEAAEPKNIQKELTEDVGTIINLSKPESKNTGENISDWSIWTAASATKNYFSEDSFLDVLKYKSSNIIKSDPNYSKDIGQMISAANNTTSFVPSLLSQGNNFETKIINLMRTELGEANCKNLGGNYAPRSYMKYLETIQAIQSGVPVIFQAVLRNYDNKTYGVADIIIRSDWINRFLDVNALSADEISIPSPKLGKNYHYVIIDIKYKTLPLRADGIHLRNDANLKAYKSQLYIYTSALAKIQGYDAPYAFILGTKWKYTKKSCSFEGKNCFERLGRIDYADLDNSYIEKTRLALEWLKDVRENDYDLSKYPLERDELYPNMCNRYDYPYHNIKKIFAEKHNDLTLLWNVGPKQRRIANKNGVYDWKDPRCTPETLGVTGKVRSKVLSRILEANHSETRNIFPKFITNNIANWKNREEDLELFVDFETTCSVFNDLDELPDNNSSSLIFLIGAGYIHPETKKWTYVRFVVNRINESEECRICCEFVNFINTLALKFHCTRPILCRHYSHAEPSAWNRFQERSNKNFDVEWADMLKLFLAEPVGISGALSYSLKTLTKAFYEHGYISTHYDSGLVCGDGADAAVGAFRANIECEKNNISFATHSLTQEIIKYNEIDCKVMQEILDYLRKNHVNPLEDEEDKIESIDSDSEEIIISNKRTNKKRRIDLDEIEESSF
jgi:hypothetical protein